MHSIDILVTKTGFQETTTHDMKNHKLMIGIVQMYSNQTMLHYTIEPGHEPGLLT